MRYNNTSVAPVLSPARRATVTPLPVKRSRTREKAHSKAGARIGVRTAAVVSVFIFFVGAWSFNLFTRAQISDVKDQIIACEESLKSLESENVSIEMQLENKVSYDNLETEAGKLGMVKRSDSQIKYINTRSEDTAEIISNSNNSNSEQ